MTDTGRFVASRDDGLAQTQRTFRQANERLQELADVLEGSRIPFLCECPDLSCLGRIEATIAEFELIHENDDCFFVIPGHRRLDAQSVTGRTERYEVVT